ncbi:MAG: hypothetical protein QNJ87_07505 [Gammaproteobacteria bacterium]|nr:hypothetical protein [Gammaproteobacteria bacterium]MDJ0871598.1 hypothetical protein [Gammaproteobacteria bacterium]
MAQAFWRLLNSNVGLLVLGFTLTTIAGSLFVDWVDRKTWERQIAVEQKRQDLEWERSRKFELLRVKLDEGQKSLEEISDLINLRFFRLHKVFENVLSGNIKAARTNWQNYMEAVERWNVKLIINQNKLRRLVSADVSDQFNNYETDDPDFETPSSIHGHFFISHKKVKDLLDCAKAKSCTVTKAMKRDVSNHMRALDLVTDEFVDRVSDLFLKRTFDLEEFRTIRPVH